MPHPTIPHDMPPSRRCGSYHPGHDVHYIQARLSLEVGDHQRRTVRDVADDGTVTFTDATAVWNHDPERLRAVLSHHGNAVLVGSHGLLRVRSGEGRTYCFSVRTGSDPCRPETAEHRSGESVVDELLRRGGILRSGRSVLAEFDGREGGGTFYS